MTQAQAPPPYCDLPEWQTLADEIHCPMCGYNLRGLAQPRCPECGHEFLWRDLLDPTRRRHPYLFEHYPDHNIRSFFATITRKLRPFTFWTSLRPDHSASLRRLLGYWIIVVVGSIVPVLIMGCIELWHHRHFVSQSNLSEILRVLTDSDAVTSMAVFGGAAAFLPLLNYLVLLLFHQSMHRAKVRPQHVLRCAVYSADIAFWLQWWLLVVLVLLSKGPKALQVLTGFMVAAGVMTAIVVHFGRLVSAYRHYMQFHAPFATVFASQLIAFLVVILLIFLYAQYA